MKEAYVYFIRLPCPMAIPETLECLEVSFAGVGRGGNECIIEVYEKSLEKADQRLRKCIDSIGARIIPVPFEIIGTVLNRIIIRARVGVDIFLVEKGSKRIEEVLPKVKSYVGEQFRLRSKQAKRLKKLLQKIENYENTLEKKLLRDIAFEMYHMAINPERL